jgi:hypothetical protein
MSNAVRQNAVLAKIRAPLIRIGASLLNLSLVFAKLVKMQPTFFSYSEGTI